MYKDLLQTLQQGAAESVARRTAAQEAQSAMLTESAPAVGGFPSAGGGGGGGYNRRGLKEGSTQQAPQSVLDQVNGVDGKPGGKLAAFLKAVSAQESGGNYQAKGVQTSSGRAYGKYQILDSNFVGPGGWDKETLGRDITLQQYMNKPKLQERIAQGKLTNYFKQYGPSGAAKAWYAGPGNANTNSDAPQYGGPSINDYAASVVKRMRGYL